MFPKRMKICIGSRPAPQTIFRLGSIQVNSFYVNTDIYIRFQQEYFNVF